jgi:ABC-type transport system involved in cytochrome c biogenesis permease component
MGTTFSVGVVCLVVCIAIIVWLQVTERHTPGEGGLIAAILTLWMMIPVAISAIITTVGAIGWLIQHIQWR